MKVRVLAPCFDKYTAEFYEVGSELDVTPERAEEMKGFVEILDTSVEEVEEAEAPEEETEVAENPVEEPVEEPVEKKRSRKE